MSRRLLALAAAACALSAAPASADPIPPNLRPGVDVRVDENEPGAGIGVWLGDYPLLGVFVHGGDNPRACAGYGYTTGICSTTVTDLIKTDISVGG